MFFKTLRTRSKSSSKSTNATATRRLSNTFSLTRRDNSKLPSITVTQADQETHWGQEEEQGQNDYQEFLEKARKDEEAREQRKLKAEKEAKRHQKQVDMSPWASRI